MNHATVEATDTTPRCKKVDENPPSLIDELMVAHKYDSWGPEGINFDHLLHFINETYYRYQERESHWYYQNYGPFLGVHSGSLLPRLFLSQQVLNRRNRGDIVKKRFRKMLPNFQDALANATTPAFRDTLRKAGVPENGTTCTRLGTGRQTTWFCLGSIGTAIDLVYGGSVPCSEWHHPA